MQHLCYGFITKADDAYQRYQVNDSFGGLFLFPSFCHTDDERLQQFFCPVQCDIDVGTDVFLTQESVEPGFFQYVMHLFIYS